MLSLGFTPVNHLILKGVLLCAVTSPPVEGVTAHRVVTFLHTPAFDAPFIIKLLGGKSLELFFKNVLTCRNQTRF